MHWFRRHNGACVGYQHAIAAPHVARSQRMDSMHCMESQWQENCLWQYGRRYKVCQFQLNVVVERISTDLIFLRRFCSILKEYGIL